MGGLLQAPAITQRQVAGRVIGIDYGSRRVGIAIADPLQLFAQPLGTYSPAESIRELKTIRLAEGIRTIVVGWPLTPEGEEGAAVDAVSGYVKRLQRALPDVEIIPWDERYTSAVARELIRGATTRRKHRRDRGRVDRAAAALILQEYLDSRSSEPRP